MVGILAIGIVGSVGYAIWQLLAAMFSSPRGLKLKRAGMGLGVAIALFITFGFVASRSAYGPTNSADETTGPRHETQAAATSGSFQEAQATEAASSEHSELMADIEASNALVTNLKADDCTGEAKAILLCAELLNGFASLYADAKLEDLTPEDRRAADAFKVSIQKKQREMLPVLRDAYGPAMRKVLWEADGKARTFGPGYRTIEFTNYLFAANRNIKQIHEEMRATLLLLRFTRVQYKWLDADVEYTYFTLEPPKDGALVTWGQDGRFTEIAN